MQSKYAVIDLGSNTFHLLIGERQSDGRIQTLYRERVYVKLAENGIETIDEIPFNRGIDALTKFRAKLDEYEIKDYLALGTATLRKASNAAHFVAQAALKSSINIRVIGGEEEAQLIHLGVRQAYPMQEDITYLIMDIGGGSVEFILCSQSELFWHQSYPAGVAILKNTFQKSNTLSHVEQQAICTWLDTLLQDLKEKLLVYKPSVMIGASGTFEVLQDAIGGSVPGEEYGQIKFSNYKASAQAVLMAEYHEIQQMDWIPSERKDLIQVAFALIQWVVVNAPIQEMAISHYAMKEGAFQRFKMS